MRRLLPLLLCLVLLSGVAIAEMVFRDIIQEESKAGDTTGETLFGEEPAELEAPISEPVEILISAAGDVTLGGNTKGKTSTIYKNTLAAHGGDLSYFFANVYDIFSQDDLTLVNFEGVLTNATKYKNNNEYVFRAPPEHVEVLTLGSIEAVSLENNHVMDFYQQGYDDTVAALEGVGIVYASEGSIGVYETKGVSIAMLAYQTFNNAYSRLMEQVPIDVAEAKAEYDIVIVSFHWGDEGEFSPHDRQVKLGRATIDAGADLVLGHHSHRINPIEYYNGKYIVYSLANCSFSGNSQPSNMDTFIFQQKFTVSDGTVTPGAFRIIPCSISSITAQSGKKSGENDFAITPFEPGGAATQRVIDTMLDNSKGLDYAVKEYPTEWR